MKAVKHLAIGTMLAIGVLSSAIASNANDEQITQTAQSVLSQAGLTDRITGIKPSVMTGMRELQLANGATFSINDTLSEIISGKLEKNPSPITPIDPALMADQPVGMPISDEYRQALLANMTALPNLTKNSQFFHTDLSNWLWGMAGNGGVPFLVSKDGKYFGDASFGKIQNGKLTLSDHLFVPAKNRQILSTLPADAMAVYPAKGKQRAVLYVATDIHCPYCRLLHQNIHRYNAQGITVKAIGYPVYDESIVPMRQIWCETDNAKRATLLTAAMKGIFTKDQSCQSDTPLKTINDTAALEILATPAIFNDKGELFMGDFADLSAVEQFLGM